ncbi:MAG: hypothetical protein DRO88_09210 [Promethearchaeia archaeon]|nr:MAG: hypothetical protein DRO88_09210 [Candidatus Lokiarchaeia archaeon]
MPQNKRKKTFFLMIELVIFGSIFGLVYWQMNRTPLSPYILWGFIIFGFFLSLITGLRLASHDNCVQIRGDSLLEAWRLPLEERKKKQQSLQLLYFDMKMRNWAGFIQHSREPIIKRNLEDFAEIMAHPTKRYSRLITNRFELKISGYEGKSAEIVDRSTKEVLSAEEENESKSAGFQRALNQLLKSYLDYYSVYMTDPVESLEQLGNLMFEHNYSLIFSKMVKFAEIFDENLFKCRLYTKKWQIQLKSADQSKFVLKKLRKGYNVKMKLKNADETQKIEWKTNLYGNLLMVHLPGEKSQNIINSASRPTKREISKIESKRIEEPVRSYISNWIEKCKSAITSSLPAEMLGK